MFESKRNIKKTKCCISLKTVNIQFVCKEEIMKKNKRKMYQKGRSKTKVMYEIMPINVQQELAFVLRKYNFIQL
jgi:hypothetical protein